MNKKELQDIGTPSFIYDEGVILEKYIDLRTICNNLSSILFPIKSFAIVDVLNIINKQADGFCVSSLFGAILAGELSGKDKSIHLTAPSIRSNEIEELSSLCDYIAFNSLSQFERFYPVLEKGVNCGIRVNPQMSFVKDDRHNPCRKHSKLGVPLDKLSAISNNGSSIFKGIKGLHFHTNSESNDFNHLLKTVKHIHAHIPNLLNQVEWINMGGGYLFDESDSLEKFHEAIYFLKNQYDVEIFIEPGKGIIGKAGCILSSVVDVFESEGKNIAVLDTTVNHMPEVFEYQYRPGIKEESETGKYKYILAGSTCLAGDLFGEYRFDEPLEIGSRITFEDMGAYSLVKANMFNGINLPSIYILRQYGKLELVKEHTYEDFLNRCGVNRNVSI